MAKKCCLMAITLLCVGSAGAQNQPALETSQAAARAVITQNPLLLADWDKQIAENRQRLEQTGIAQQRVAEAVSRIQGTALPPSSLENRISQTSEVLQLLEDAMIETRSLLNSQPGVQQMQRAAAVNAQIVRQLLADYWAFAGLQQVYPQLLRLTEQAQELIEPFRRARREVPAAEEHLKKSLLGLLSRLQQHEQLYQEKRRGLSRTLGLDENYPLQLWAPPGDELSIPALTVEDEQLVAYLLQQLDAAPADSLEQVQQYQENFVPGIRFDASQNSEEVLKNWLIVGKNTAFDLYNLLDNLQRRQLFKTRSDEKQTDPQVLLTSARFALTRLNLARYRQYRQLYALGFCLARNQAQFQQHYQAFEAESPASQLRKLQQSLDALEAQIEAYQLYGELQAGFFSLQTSLGVPLPLGLENSNERQLAADIRQARLQLKQPLENNIFSCFRPEQEIAEQQQKNLQLIREKQAETERADKLAAELADIRDVAKQKRLAAEKARKDWLTNQKPQQFTLQIRTSRSMNDLQTYINRYQLGKTARIVETRYRNKPLFHLVYGVYANRELAYIAQFKLPLAVQENNTISTRRFSELQKQLK